MLRTGCADVVRTQSSAGRVATTPISASIIGAMQVQEAMKLIHKEAGEETQFRTLQGKMLRYEGMTNTMNIYKYASWKKNCSAHERWSQVVECPELSAQTTVKEALKILKKRLKVKALEINMRNNKFVDKIIADKSEQEFDVMVPESKLDAAISENATLRKLSYRTLFHKSFFENLDKDFPYQDMTLQQIGIPPFDVIQVSTDKGLFYVELSADKSQFI
jgi:adenylyltransferase/sulfurtransferase